MNMNTDILVEIRDLLKELVKQREEVESVQNETTCKSKTAKGKPCTNKRIADSEYCGMHAPEKRRKLKETKPDKIVPTHSHDVDTPDPSCSLCKSHGDCLDVDESRVVYSMEERLKNILKSE